MWPVSRHKKFEKNNFKKMFDKLKKICFNVNVVIDKPSS